MSSFVTALKSYGQHFLNDQPTLEQINSIIKKYYNQEDILEIGPGMGALTSFLINEYKDVTCIEIDQRCIDYLKEKHKDALGLKIINGDFLKLNLNELLKKQTAVVGNFPYNISSQIVFSILDHYDKIPFMVGMFQKEMGHRIASSNNSKEYGIISVLTQLYYEVKVEFDIAPSCFTPPPKVMSSVISLKRKNDICIDFDLALFKKIVKAGFNQRRKMLRNGLSGCVNKDFLQQAIFTKRAEQLSVADFIDLTKLISQQNAT